MVVSKNALASYTALVLSQRTSVVLKSRQKVKIIFIYVCQSTQTKFKPENVPTIWLPKYGAKTKDCILEAHMKIPFGYRFSMHNIKNLTKLIIVIWNYNTLTLISQKLFIMLL